MAETINPHEPTLKEQASIFAKQPRLVVTTNCNQVDNYLLGSLTNTDYLIHNDPRAMVRGMSEAPYKMVDANFDIYIDCSVKGSDQAGVYTKEHLGDKYIDATRLPKSLQLPMLAEAGFEVPAYTYSVKLGERINVNADVSAVDALGLDADQYFIIKAEHGAKGETQVKCQVKDAARVCNVLGLPGDIEEDLERLKPYVTIGGEEHSHKKTISTLMSGGYGSFHYEAFVPDIVAEYRIIFNSTCTYYVIKREIGAQAEYQARGTEGEYMENNDLKIGVHEKIQALIQLCGLPFGSIDIYERATGEFGAFEFCPQFGYVAFPDPAQVVNLIMAGVIHTLEKNK